MGDITFVLGILLDEATKRKRELAELLFVLAVGVVPTEQGDEVLDFFMHIVLVAFIIVVITLLNTGMQERINRFCLSTDMVEAKDDWVNNVLANTCDALTESLREVSVSVGVVERVVVESSHDDFPYG